MKNFILGLLVVIFSLSQLIAQNSERLKLIDEFIEKSVEDGVIPGGVFKVSLAGEMIYDRTVGYIDTARTRPYKSNDIFRIASMTKAITSVAIMQLYEDGQLLIDDPVSQYIPAFGEIKVLDTFNEADSSYTVKDLDRPITIRHLMTHTSGIYYGVFMNGRERAVYMQNDAMGYGFSHEDKTTEEMVNHIASLPLAHQPGTRWTYGLNMEVMGRIVEVVSGMSLDEYFNRRIFQPLGMYDTHFYLPSSKKNRLVPVYMQTDDGVRMSRDQNYNYPIEGFEKHFAGGGGLSSTAGDYLKFVQALVNGGSLNGNRILGYKTVEYMSASQTLHLKPKPNSHTRPGGYLFGLGFATFTEESLGAVPFSPGTYFWGGYFNTKFWIDPEEKLALVAMTQVYPFENGAFWDKLYALIYSVLEESSLDPEFSGDVEKVRNAIEDYVDGLYLVDSSRIERSVHPELRKRGYWYYDKENAYQDNLDMSFNELVNLAANWNKNGQQVDNSSPRHIEIYDINDKTASAKLTAEWGIDYFHLAKIKGKWYIMNVLWQSLKD